MMATDRFPMNRELLAEWVERMAPLCSTHFLGRLAIFSDKPALIHNLCSQSVRLAFDPTSREGDRPFWTAASPTERDDGVSDWCRLPMSRDRLHQFGNLRARERIGRCGAVLMRDTGNGSTPHMSRLIMQALSTDGKRKKKNSDLENNPADS